MEVEVGSNGKRTGRPAAVEEVRIVHGSGTGALRKAVHEYLKGLRITGYRLGVENKDPGGAGVTIVTL